MPKRVRLAVTADLHHDVHRSREPAEALAVEFLNGDFDALLVVGDCATSDRDGLEACLNLFGDDERPRLFVPGNHELWSRHRGIPADVLLNEELPRRVTEAGWHWLPTNPFRFDNGWAIVGTGGWYDHAYAEPRLGLPQRFYEAGLTPRAARMTGRDDLRPDADDVPEAARDFAARWNDLRFIAGLDDDAAFCRERLAEFEADLAEMSDAAGVARVVAAVHVCPTRSLLPPVPPTGPVPAAKRKFAFARAYLGSPTFGAAALKCPQVRHLVCGHSHVPRDHVTDAGVHCQNIGSTYTEKRLLTLDLG